MESMETEGLNVCLEHWDLVHLVLSVCPSYKILDEFIDRKLGRYVGGHVERWEWNYPVIEKLDNSDLYELYLYVKNSWLT